jgi:HCOMODA/2-hydroxy-3-carboxy-muconic semialdehyde decarboxylase
VFRAYYTELNARLQLQARTLEGPLTFISAQESADTFGGTGITPHRAWEMWVREVKL